jgi:hypothetical protein
MHAGLCLVLVAVSNVAPPRPELDRGAYWFSLLAFAAEKRVIGQLVKG